jgi:hypothetical protein
MQGVFFDVNDFHRQDLRSAVAAGRHTQEHVVVKTASLIELEPILYPGLTGR